jgi:hypothetical protein
MGSLWTALSASPRAQRTYRCEGGLGVAHGLFDGDGGGASSGKVPMASTLRCAPPPGRGCTSVNCRIVHGGRSNAGL